jgi:hypothetical protein
MYSNLDETEGSKSKLGKNADCIIEYLLSEQPSPARFSVYETWTDASTLDHFHTGYSGNRVIMVGKSEDFMGYLSISGLLACTLVEASDLKQCLENGCFSINWFTNCHPIKTGICPSESCINGAQDGTESDIDCGGSCLACAKGKACNTQSDCYTDMICENGKCATAPVIEPSCDNQVQDGDEADVDCGGSCPKLCENGQKCIPPRQGPPFFGTGIWDNCKSGCCRQFFCDQKLIYQSDLTVCVPFTDSDGDGHCDAADYCSTAAHGTHDGGCNPKTDDDGITTGANFNPQETP